jgi:hypothetical protein
MGKVSSYKELNEEPKDWSDFNQKLLLLVDKLSVPKVWFDWYVSRLNQSEKQGVVNEVFYKGVKLWPVINTNQTRDKLIS